MQSGEGGASAYRFRRLGLDDKLILFEILRDCKLHSGREDSIVAQYLERDLHGGGCDVDGLVVAAGQVR